MGAETESAGRSPREGPVDSQEVRISGAHIAGIHIFFEPKRTCRPNLPRSFSSFRSGGVGLASWNDSSRCASVYASPDLSKKPRKMPRSRKRGSWGKGAFREQVTRDSPCGQQP
jgi:hypothetical protein